mmetsp:Transcript_3128/g.6260  ORF Transcript_3128/g.6260 Transcript_3128/m.6260 type:complete len:237 (+) Transcript_3128:2934-3644(+)
MEQHIQIKPDEVVTNDDIWVDGVDLRQEEIEKGPLVAVDETRRVLVLLVVLFHLLLNVEGPGSTIQLPRSSESEKLLLWLVCRPFNADLRMTQRRNHRNLVRVLPLVFHRVHVETQHAEWRALRRVPSDLLDVLGVADLHLCLAPTERHVGFGGSLDVQPTRSHQIPLEEEVLHARLCRPKHSLEGASRHAAGNRRILCGVNNLEVLGVRGNIRFLEVIHVLASDHLALVLLDALL